jgi:hypothetical protein
MSVTSRTRPLRFGFLVRPDDKVRLRKIFQINACLWGGEFNPIIPIFTRVPGWWERRGIRFKNAKQILNGYLDFFEPDLVVEAEQGLAAGLGIDQKRVLQLSDILRRADGERRETYGLDVMDLYRQMYREEYQFVRRHPHQIKVFKPTDKSFEGFVECAFGLFPKAKDLLYFGKAFKDAFDPEYVALDGASLAKLYRSGFSSPLIMGQQKLEVDYNNRDDPVLYILDAKEPRDLIDFWNYRAVQGRVVPIPVQWLPELSDYCKSFIERNHRPIPGNPHGVMFQPKSMFSRSIPEQDIGKLHSEYLSVPITGANTIQVWYPPIWQRPSEMVASPARPTVAYATKNTSSPIDVEKPQIDFEVASPEFAEKYGGEYRWATVISLHDWSLKDQIATVYPTDFRSQCVGRLHVGLDPFLYTTEGFVLFERFKDASVHLALQDGATAHARWLKDRNIVTRLSDAGRASQQIIQTLGGFWGVTALAHPDIVRLLDGMSRRPVLRSAHQDEFRQKVQKAIGKSVWLDRTFKVLVERRAVELGYELKCPKCGEWSWYALSQLDNTVSCGLCLRKSEFPITEPSNSKVARWAYRVIGPFALPDYARGGYAAALALRFFADVVSHGDRADTTWSAGQELTLPNGDKAEADFIVWYQRKRMFGTNRRTEVIFGEAKSFGKDRFADEDIQRMKQLAETFPGSILVFATMKNADALSKDEVKRLRKLAQWGREYDQDAKRSRAPVIVLTGLELFSEWYLEHTWKQKGGQHADFVAPASVSLENLRRLADFTQQLYLGMPSYSQWREAYWKKRHARRGQKAGKASLAGKNQAGNEAAAQEHGED